MLIGIVQHVVTSSINMNLETIRRFVLEAHELGCRCVCFPECSLTGYVPEQAKGLAISRDSSVINELAMLSQTSGIDLLIGFMEESQGRYYITHGIFSPNGTSAFYQKTHLGKREQLYFTPGDSLTVFPLSCGLSIGFQLCVETHFPDISQTLSLRGAEVIFAPHAVPRSAGDRERIWNKYIPARAYDNRVYMACCNQWDSEKFGGGCVVVDPRGDVVCSSYEQGESIIVASIDLELFSNFRTESEKRSNHYFPKRRRVELYE